MVGRDDGEDIHPPILMTVKGISDKMMERSKVIERRKKSIEVDVYIGRPNF